MTSELFSMRPQYIPIFRGDDTDFKGNKKIMVKINTDLDLTGCSAHFKCLSFVKDFGTIPTSKELEIVFTSTETKKFKLGCWDAELYIIDNNGKRKTVENKIRIHVTNSIYEAYCEEGDRVIGVTIGSPVVSTVNGKTGAVVLTGADISFDGEIPTTIDSVIAGKLSTTGGNVTGTISSTERFESEDDFIIVGADGPVHKLSEKVSTSDSRLTDARTPTSHKSTHATGGADALTAADIGALPTAGGTVHGSLALFDDGREVRLTVGGTTSSQGGGVTTKRSPGSVHVAGSTVDGVFVPASILKDGEEVATEEYVNNAISTATGYAVTTLEGAL